MTTEITNLLNSLSYFENEPMTLDECKETVKEWEADGVLDEIAGLTGEMLYYHLMGIKEKVESCKTKAEVMRVLKENGMTISKDESKESGYFNVWVDSTARIYKSGKRFFFQTWKPVKMTYSGIPVFFG